MVSCRGQYKPNKNLKWDGIDLWPILKGKNDGSKERLLYCKGVNGTNSTLHKWPWKLIVGKSKDQLFNLSKDPNEKNDVADTEKKKLQELKEFLEIEVFKDNDDLP